MCVLNLTNHVDFDDEGDEFGSKTLFGRSGATSLWGDAASSALDSPSIVTPSGHDRNEKSYFHSRGDSVASEDSSHSVQFSARKIKASFAHSAQSSVATTSSSAFAKKTSFASLRNAFKSSKSSEPAPPVPVLDQQAYPALKNPFNRSTSSLAHISSTPRPSIHSQSNARPSTPASGDSKFRGTPKSKGHTSARSQHSTSGSIFHFSDGGSDHGHGFSFSSPSSPPPVPPVPNAFGHVAVGGEPLSPPDFEEKSQAEARTPSDFALGAIFIRFATLADSLIHTYVSQPLVCHIFQRRCDPQLIL